MITWMSQSLLAAAMVAGGALAVEEMARLLGRPLRWGWLGAMVTAVALPLAFRFVPAAPLQPVRIDAVTVATLAGAPPAREPVAALPVGTLVGALWIVTATIMGAALLLTLRRLARVRSSGRPVHIAGFPALLTRATGPLVVGLRKPAVLVPRWIDELDPAEQRLILRHEWEHVRAGDTALLMMAAVIVAAMPWNLPLWWMRRRLRSAIEIDCDARVLAGGADRRIYGGVLIRTAGRPRTAPLLTPALVELPSLLERRIVAMTRKPARLKALRLGIATTLAGLLFVVACELTPRGGALSPTEPSLAQVLDAEEDTASAIEEFEVVTDPVKTFVFIEEARVGDSTRMVMMHDTVATRIRLQATADGQLSTGSARPLFIVNGVIADGEVKVGSLDGVDPAKIERVEVIKGEPAVQWYGERAKDGVVQIYTREGEPTWVDASEPGRVIRVDTVRGFHFEPAKVSDQPVEVAVGSGVAPGRIVAPLQDGPRHTFTYRGGPEPLVIVDGEEIGGPSALARIGPERIESITVLKDASATAAYGEKGKNGVILVTTRKAP